MKIKTNKGQILEFSQHRFLWDFLHDDHNRIALRKCTQVGASLSVVLKILYSGCQDNINILYTLPTSGDAKDFVTTKFDPIVSGSPGLTKLVGRSDIRNMLIYSALLKKIAGSHYLFRGCFDDQTEILTNRGWQTIDTLIQGESLPTIDLKTNRIVIDTVKQVFKYDVNEKLIHFKSQNIDQMVTADHRCLVKQRRHKNFEIRRAREIKSSSHLSFPLECERLESNGLPESIAFYKVLGWVISEGTYWTERCKRKLKDRLTIYEYPRVSICQKTKCAQLRQDLKAAKIKWYEKKQINGCLTFELSRSAAKKIREISIDKKLSIDLVFKLSGNQRNALCQGLLLGDGSSNGYFYQANLKTSEAFQILLALLGRCSYLLKRSNENDHNRFSQKPSYEIRRRNDKTANRFEINSVSYNRKVWCPQTNQGTVIIRRNGKVQFSGQSWVEHAAQTIDTDILVVDELDFQKPEVRKMYEKRLTGSNSQDKIYWIGTPTLPQYGIDDLYEMSDQRKWHIQCPHCKLIQTLEWPNSISFQKKTFVCVQCRQDLQDSDRIRGKWIVTRPDQPAIHGYYFNSLMVPWVSALELITEYQNSNTNKRDFFNFRLGLPYLEKNQRMEKEEFQALEMNIDEYKKLEKKKLVVGIDQGNRFHVTVGHTDGEQLVFVDMKIIENDANSRDNELDNLEKFLDKANADMYVMDRFPDQHYARKLQKRYGKERFFLSTQRQWALKGTYKSHMEVDRGHGMISIDRTEALEDFYDALHNKAIRYYYACPLLDIVLTHIRNLVSDVRRSDSNRTLTRKMYKKLGPEDFTHASNYAMLAGKLFYTELGQPVNHITEKSEERPLPDDQQIPGSDTWLEKQLEEAIMRVRSGPDEIVISAKRK